MPRNPGEPLSNRFCEMIEDKKPEELPSTINILDIGCRWGFAEKFVQPENLGAFKIYGFDPDVDECARLQQHYMGLPEGTIECIPQALAGKPGKRNLYVTKEPACSSLYPPIQYLVDRYPALDCIRLEKMISVNVTTLDRWGEENGIGDIDYIKIDTQGSELEILQGGENLLKTVRCIDIEVEFNPIYEGQGLFFEVDAHLRRHGFQLWRFANLVHYSQGAKEIDTGEKNLIHFDSKVSCDSPAYGGQLFWADARYVHSSVLMGESQYASRKQKDIRLFTVLNMADVVDHIQANGGRI